MSSFSKFDPRNKLATVNDALSSLINNKFIPDLILKIALDEIDAFVHFFIEVKEPSAQQLIELLMPGKKVIEVALKGESSIKEVVEALIEAIAENKPQKLNQIQAQRQAIKNKYPIKKS